MDVIAHEVDQRHADATTSARSWRDWVLTALPAMVFVATFGWFFVDKNREARTVFTSGRGLLTAAAIVVGYLVIGFALRRLVRWAWVAPLVLTLIIGALAAWIVRPYYVDETGDRELVAGVVRDASEMASPPAAQGPAGQPSQPEPNPSDDPVVRAPAEPVRISTGTIRGIGHDGSGSISVIRNPDGSRIVRFETFDIEGVPDPRVHLIEGNDVRKAGGVDLGGLEANQGEVFDYEVPAGTDVGPGWTVLVWCRAFSVPVANATQAAA